MIKDKTIYFGYGTIAVSIEWDGLRFTEIKPPQEIGSNCNPGLNDGSITLLNKIHISINMKELRMLQMLLADVTESNCVFGFAGYTFDFTKYDPGSIDVVQRKLERLSNSFMYIIPYAC